MPYAHPTRARPPVVGVSLLVLLALALSCAALPTRAADVEVNALPDTAVTIKAFPPSIHIAAASTEKDDSDFAVTESKRVGPRVRIDTDDDFDAFTSQLEKMPWVIGLIFLVVGSIFLTPLIVVVGVIWYKLRKARLQNQAMLALAEKGVVPPAQAADALASGASPASVAPQVYQQAVALRKRVVWSDLRKGVILGMVGLAFLFYAITSSGEPSWVGLVLLFVGAGYIVLWWLEGRHLTQPGGAGSGSGTNSSGG
jgi:hypothetical protein